MRTALLLFTCDRPRHTAEVLAAVARCGGLDRVDVVLHQDGPRPGGDAAGHARVAELLAGITFCKPRIARRDRNVGAGEAIIDGVTSQLRDHDAVIVLEDDTVPSSCFLEFTLHCLERFEGTRGVHAISGYAPPSLPHDYPYDVCFAPLPSRWGWATWRDRWARFDARAEGWKELLGDRRKREAFEAAGTVFSSLLRDEVTGKSRSWVARWHYAIARAGGVCVYPLRPYVRNIGLSDEAARHLDVTLDDRFDGVRMIVPPQTYFEAVIQRAFRQTYEQLSPESVMRALRHPDQWRGVARQLWRLVRK